MTKHSGNQLSHFCRQSIMAWAIITGTYCRVMAVYTKGRTDACSRRKRQKRAAGVVCKRILSCHFTGNLSKRVNFYPLSENVPIIMYLIPVFHYSPPRLRWAIIREERGGAGKSKQSNTTWGPSWLLDIFYFIVSSPWSQWLLTGGKLLPSLLIDSPVL